MRRSLIALLLLCTFSACGGAGESDGGSTPSPSAARDATEMRPSTMAAATVEAPAAAGEAVAPEPADAAAAERAAAPPAAAPAARARPQRGVVVRLVRSQFGRILGDGRGQAFYLFERETTSRPRCYGDCARAWPPVFARGTPVAGRGADPDLIGTTRRADGRRQLTYRGQPMYYYVSDSPGVVLCQNVDEFGGLWLVVKADGRALA